MRDQHDMIVRDRDDARQQPLAPMPYFPTPPPVARPPEGDLNYFRGILRYFWLVILFGLVGIGAALIYLNTATPLYRAYSQIYIEPSGPKILNETINANERNSHLYTQCGVIKSTTIFNMVAELPGMRDLRTFEVCKHNPVPYLREYLDADVGRKDDIITVEIKSPYAEDAAQIVNAVVDAYIRYQSMEKRTAASDQLRVHLDSKAKSDAEIKALTDMMLEFKAQHPNLNLEMVISHELTALSAARVQAEIALIDLRARLGERHPNVQAAQRQFEEYRRQYEGALHKYMNLNAQASEYAKMLAELATKQDFGKRLDEIIRNLEMVKDAQQIFNTVQVLEPALVPYAPSYPRKYRTMAVSVFCGMLLGAGLALLRDRLDGRMRSIEEIQTIIGLPVLGVVPQMGGRRTAVARAMTVHLDPRSVVAEAYRTIRTAVYFGVGSNRCKTILITSPEPGDGKTTSASNIAIAIAQTGRSVLLLDADFRKPTQHKNLDIKESTGLSSVLAGRETLERAIQHTGVEGLNILPCGPIPANPSEILNSREFGELVDALASKYDHIIFDSPPVNAVTDARILGAVCDATILVLRADKSTRKSGEHARNALLAVGARVLGVVVNDAPARKGYEIYGGSYYGQSDVPVRSTDAYDATRSRRTLPRPAMDAVEGQI